MFHSNKRSITITSPHKLQGEELEKLQRSLEKKYDDSSIEFANVIDSQAMGIEITIKEPEPDPNKKIVTITSAIGLSKDQLKTIKEAVQSKYSDRDLIFNEVVDPRVIGGVKLKVDSFEYDSTLKGKLDRLHWHLQENL